ncbi:unnamed protein product, partial [Durusdinium trenchii]
MSGLQLEWAECAAAPASAWKLLDMTSVELEVSAQDAPGWYLPHLQLDDEGEDLHCYLDEWAPDGPSLVALYHVESECREPGYWFGEMIPRCWGLAVREVPRGIIANCTLTIEPDRGVFQAVCATLAGREIARLQGALLRRPALAMASLAHRLKQVAVEDDALRSQNQELTVVFDGAGEELDLVAVDARA